MDEAARLVADEERGAAHVENGTALLSSFQSGGRGRLKDRRWISGPGKSVLATLIFRRGAADLAEGTVSTISLRTALALCMLLEEEFTLKPEIKWPNDVLVGGCKLSGILSELRRKFLFVGIGINCLQEKADIEELQEELKEELRAGDGRRLSSIRMETGARPAPATVFGKLLPRLASAYRMTSTDLVEKANARLFRRNERVRVAVGHPERGNFCEGLQIGIAENGTLLIEEAGGLRRHIASGEIA